MPPITPPPAFAQFTPPVCARCGADLDGDPAPLCDCCLDDLAESLTAALAARDVPAIDDEYAIEWTIGNRRQQGQEAVEVELYRIGVTRLVRLLDEAREELAALHEATPDGAPDLLD
jgi:hypothetical protein